LLRKKGADTKVIGYHFGKENTFLP